jgi:ribosomal protein S18 acetylase RimI-like enzyme
VTIPEHGLQLRPAGDGEVEFFFSTRRDGFRAYAEEVFGPWDESRQRASAERDFAEQPIEIVEQGGAAIGYVIVERHDDHLFLDEIALVPAVRRRGLGGALVRSVMARARDAGLPLRLSVLVNNPAQRLYVRLGFVVTRVEHPRIKMAWTDHLATALPP